MTEGRAATMRQMVHGAARRRWRVLAEAHREPVVAHDLVSARGKLRDVVLGSINESASQGISLAGRQKHNSLGGAVWRNHLWAWSCPPPLEVRRRAEMLLHPGLHDTRP